jgi:cytochrome c oxidase cbb3-type subunit 3
MLPLYRCVLPIACSLLAALGSLSCGPSSTPSASTASGAVQLNDRLQPGRDLRQVAVRGREGNAYAVSEGKRLYEQWNCAGCHSPRGGGNIGPSLMDSVWVYGSSPENIFATIVEGRPNGMPAFRGRINNDDVWKLVAHVRTLAALTSMNVRSGRGEGMHQAGPPDPQERPQIPMERRRTPLTLPPDSTERR